MTFTGSHGEPLAGRLDLPIGPVRAVALFAHCFTCDKETVTASRISRRLAEHGVAVLRFDFTGLGESGGDFANTNFTSNVEDLVHAADHLRESFAAPAILIGHSLGGAAVLAAAERVPESRAVATIGAPADPEHVTHLLDRAREEIEAEGEATVRVAGQPFRVRAQFLADVESQPQRDRIARLGRALLVMHAPRDEVVGIDNARIIYDAARHPKSFVSLDHGDHLLTDPADASYAASVLAAWASRYIPPPPEELTDDAGRRHVTVSEAGDGPYAQQIAVGPHILTADEPPSVGGADTGPDPYGLLLASLGACTSMTLRMYAERKGLPLRHVTVTLEHTRIYAEDCANCETQSGRVDHIRRDIEVEGELDDEQRARLLEIAEKCPVHRTLRSETVIESSLR